MDKLVECVPNFSEGRDVKKIARIVRAIEAIKGVRLLNVESNADHNRTVITFVGEPEAVLRAAFNAISKAVEVIDMSAHKGAHPRIGACDVCPFVPLQHTSMAECVALAENLGRKVGAKLGIPVFLYEEAASNSGRKNLASIRRGEYEGLREKLKDPAWQPDFGPAVFSIRSGATVIGARPFLIAYNLNLDSTDIKIAERIAGFIRESGRGRMFNGRTVRFGGCLKAVKALGVVLEGQHFNTVQVSVNLTDFKVTPLHIVYETIRALAELAGTVIYESEIVGLAPKEAMLETGRFYSGGDAPEEELILSAIRNLRLKEFTPDKKIIELMID